MWEKIKFVRTSFEPLDLDLFLLCSSDFGIRDCLDIQVGDINRARCAFLEIYASSSDIMYRSRFMRTSSRIKSVIYSYDALARMVPILTRAMATSITNDVLVVGDAGHDWWPLDFLTASGLMIIFSVCPEHRSNSPKNVLLSLELAISSSAVWCGCAKAR